MVRLCFLAYLLLNGVMYVRGQTNLPLVESNVNVDSIILDSMRKAYIINHIPLSNRELKQFSQKGSSGLYGEYSTPLLEKSSLYKAQDTPTHVYAPRIKHKNSEWVFYLFCFLAMYAAYINRVSSSFFRQMIKGFFDDGFIFRQVRDQLLQMPYISFFYNLLFLVAGSLYLYFGLGWDQSFVGFKRWFLLSSIAVSIFLIYGMKNFFLSVLGWMFSLRESFKNYAFVVSLQNKLLSVFLLFSSFLMGFSDENFSSYVFKVVALFILLIYIFRIIRGFQIFTDQARLKFFSLFLAFVSLEALPTALLFKFLSRSVSLIVDGWM